MKPSTAILIGLACLGIILLPASAFAAGTPAGTVITNFATMNYKDLAGNAYPSFNSNTVSITVAQVAGVALTPSASSHASGANVNSDYSIILTNTGNGNDKYNLTASSTQIWTTQLYLDANQNGILDGTESSATISVTSTLAADSSVHLIARVFVPAGTLSGTVNTMTVTATSQFKGTVTTSGLYTTSITAATINLTKTVTPSNPKPGDVVTFTVGYANSGTSRGDSVYITDQLSTNFTLVDGSYGTGTYNSSNRTITWSLGNVSGGQSGSQIFQVTVNAGVLEGTVIDNQASLAFIDSANGNHITGTSPIAHVTVAKYVYGTATITPSSQYVDVGLNAQYKIVLTNLGNGEETLQLSTISRLALSWIFWIDANQDGIAGNDGDYILDVNGFGPIAPNGGILHILAIATIPAMTGDNAIDTSSFSIKSIADPFTGTVTAVTMVRAPQMTLAKSYGVEGAGDPIPGATIIFTLAYQNNGSGAAASVIISDIVPEHMTFVPGSIKLNGVAQTDAQDGDVSEFTNGMAMVNVGTVGAGASGTIEFRATIN